MTTRSGFVGLITGLIVSAFLYLFFAPWQYAIYNNAPQIAARWAGLGICVTCLLFLVGGFVAARWSGSVEALRCTILGALAGVLAAMFVFCLWGAAVAGLMQWHWQTAGLVNPSPNTYSQLELTGILIRQTMSMFLVLFAGGGFIGAVGGRLAYRKQNVQSDVFDMEAPQMALNATITVVPASVVAAALAAFIYPRLLAIFGTQGSVLADTAALQMPLYVSLVWVVITHFILIWVVPHETRQSEHLSGMDEVKMAAFVSIGTAPLLVLFLLLIDAKLLIDPVVIVFVVLSMVMSIYSIRILSTQVLPKRASYNLPRAAWQKTEADLFGTIAKSRGLRLVVLCIGCGIVMVLPIQAVVLSVLINLNTVTPQTAFVYPSDIAAGLFMHQASISMGIMLAVVTFLSLIYIFYFNLGRWFSHRNQQNKKAGV